jgi:hypothetical protein
MLTVKEVSFGALNRFYGTVMLQSAAPPLLTSSLTTRISACLGRTPFDFNDFFYYV